MNIWHVEKEDYFGQQHFKGTIALDEPMGFLILAYDRSGYGYSKVSKNTASTRIVDCFFHVLPDDRVQVILRIDDTVHSTAIWPGHSFEVQKNVDFADCVPFTVASGVDSYHILRIVGIPATKLRNLKKGIWSVKKEFIDAFPELHKDILLKSRHGYEQFST